MESSIRRLRPREDRGAPGLERDRHAAEEAVAWWRSSFVRRGACPGLLDRESSFQSAPKGVRPMTERSCATESASLSESLASRAAGVCRSCRMPRTSDARCPVLVGRISTAARADQKCPVLRCDPVVGRLAARRRRRSGRSAPRRCPRACRRGAAGPRPCTGARSCRRAGTRCRSPSGSRPRRRRARARPSAARRLRTAERESRPTLRSRPAAKACVAAGSLAVLDRGDARHHGRRVAVSTGHAVEAAHVDGGWSDTS